MNDHIQQSQKTYAISGMDVSTHICPDLKTFNHFLVSGKGHDNSGEISTWSAHHLEDNPELFLNQLSESLKNIFNNSQIGASPSNKGSFSVLIHNPFDKNECAIFNNLPISRISTVISEELGVVIDQIEVLTCPFPEALHQATLIIEKGNSAHVALISPFKYIAPNPDQLICIGIGSLFFSQDDAAEERYASLIIENMQGHAIAADRQNILDGANSHGEEFSSGAFTHFQQAPVIRLIGSIQELNHKSHFSLLRNSSCDEISVKDIPGMYIRPWFSPPYDGKRKHVLIQNNGENISIEENLLFTRDSRKVFLNFGYYLLPVPIDDPESGIQKINELISILSKGGDVKEIVRQSLQIIGERKTGKNILVVLGESRQDLINELDRARSGIVGSLETGKDWQTPNGSYFAPNPLGPDEKIAFVYPGAFSTYIGMGSEIFYLFPELYEKLQEITEDPAASINESVIYPPEATSGELDDLQNQLNSNPIKMITSGVVFSFLFSEILRDIFKIKLDTAFGYSLGEISMMFAMGIWKQADAMRTSLEVSPVFHSRVSGPQLAIREFWNMPSEKDHTGSSIWANFVLMASPEKVNNSIIDEDHVYLTHINTPRQVVIGGEKDACQRVADAVKCMHLQAPYHHAIHCPPVASEYEGFVRLHDWPIENDGTIPIYSAANYAPLEKESKSIAHSFAKMLTNPIDFPRLINLAYLDGARIFIELGAGNNCSKWIDATLKGKPHAAFSINQNNISDHVSILRLLARLISHKVSINLDPLRSM